MIINLSVHTKPDNVNKNLIKELRNIMISKENFHLSSLLQLIENQYGYIDKLDIEMGDGGITSININILIF